MEKTPITRHLKEQGYPSVGGIRRRDSIPQLIPEKDNWIRGKAHIEGEHVCLDAESCEKYCPEKEDRLVFLDFLNLDVNNQSDIVEFVEQYGLLSYVGLEDGCEDLDFWAEAHLSFLNLIQRHIDIQKADRDETGAFNKLAIITDSKYAESLKALVEGIDLSPDEIAAHNKIIERHGSGMFGDRDTMSFSSNQKEELLRVANLNMALQLSIFMGEIAVGTSFRPLSLPQQNKKSPKSSLVLDYRSPDLYGYLWIQVAFWVVDGKNLGKCECGKYFPMTRSNRQSCKEGCGSNLRVKKKREKDKQDAI